MRVQHLHPTSIIVAALAVAVVGPSLLSATEVTFEATKYVWEVRRVTEIGPDAADMKARLAGEVEKILAAGHLAPMRCMYGEIEPHFFQWQPGESTYALGLAYPHLPRHLQPKVVEYVRRELAKYPPWSVRFLPPLEGTFIEWHARNVSATLRQNDWNRWWGMYAQRYHNLHALYGLWLYADRSGEWKPLADHYPAIAAMFERGEPKIAQYMDIAGAIGFARIARHMQDRPREELAVRAVTRAMLAGLDYAAFVKHTQETNGAMGGHGTAQTLQYLDPEVARYLADTNREAVVKHLESLHRTYPFWFLAMPPHPSGQFGESVGMGPDIRNGMMTAAALIEGLSATELRRRLDLPWTPRGDLYYMQHLVWTIEAHGRQRWEP